MSLGYQGIAPRVINLLHHVLIEIGAFEQGPGACLQSGGCETESTMERIRILYEGLTLIQGIMRMPSAGPDHVMCSEQGINSLDCSSLLPWLSDITTQQPDTVKVFLGVCRSSDAGQHCSFKIAPK